MMGNSNAGSSDRARQVGGPRAGDPVKQRIRRQPMFGSRSVIVIVGVVMLLAVSTFAAAADMASYRGREGRSEITLQPRYLASKTINFDGGTSIDTDADLGFGMGFGLSLIH